MAIVLHNIGIAFRELSRATDVALLTQIKDTVRLEEQRRLCLEFQANLRMYTQTLSAPELQLINKSIDRMVAALDEAATLSSDYPDAPPLNFGGFIHNGNPGHPRIDIHPEDLARLAEGRTTHKAIADIYDCSPRTIRRRLLEYCLSSPGPPVYMQEEQEDGSIQRVYYPGTSSDLSQLSDVDLDALMLDIY